MSGESVPVHLHPVWREGDRLRRKDGMGYGDQVSDEQIRSHIASDDGSDPLFVAFAETVLAMREYERGTTASTALTRAERMAQNDAATGTLGERLVQAGNHAIASRYDHVGTVSYRTDVRAALAAMLPLLVEAIEARWAEAYAPEVFRPVTDTQVTYYHGAFDSSGLSVDRWSAHILQYGYHDAADVIRSAAEAVSQ